MRTWKSIPVLLAAATLLGGQPAPKVRPSPLDPHNDKGAITLLVLGCYHMEGSGQDATNLATGDVLSPGKQQEIGVLLDRLEAYRPTKVLIEAPFHTSRTPADYTAYLAGTYTLSRNETNQVAFALARRLGHKTVFPVDYPMWMDGRVPQEIGTPRPKAAPTTSSEPKPAPALPEVYRLLQEKLQKGTVLETFRYLNSPAYAQADHAFYVRMLHPDPTTDNLYEGANALTHWYKRNLRILSNLYRVAEPGDRVLLLIGSGHLTLLNQWAVAAGDLALMDTAAYLED